MTTPAEQAVINAAGYLITEPGQHEGTPGWGKLAAALAALDKAPSPKARTYLVYFSFMSSGSNGVGNTFITDETGGSITKDRILYWQREAIPRSMINVGNVLVLGFTELED